MEIHRIVTTVLFGAGLLALTVSSAAAKSLVFCSEGSPEGFDAALYTSDTTFDASSGPLYNRLVEFRRGTTEIVPGLAESWSYSEDGRELTFNLRKGVRFHTTGYFTPNRDFNADDVLFTFERQRNRKHAWNGYVPGTAWEYFNGTSMSRLVRKIEKVDDHTATFVLRRPHAPVISILAMDFASIVSAEYAEKLEADGRMGMLNREPVGTGPFVLEDYKADEEIRFKAHADYWDGKPSVDDLVFAITPEAAERLEKLKAGDCHVMAAPDPGVIKDIEAEADLAVMKQPGLDVGYLAYNTRVPPFDRKEVRKALNLAVDRKAIVREVFNNAGEAAKTPIPPAMWSHNGAIADDAHDPELAGKMLAEAGVEDLSMKVWAMPVARPYNPDAQRVADLIKADLEKVGVTVEVVSYKWGEYLRRARSVRRRSAVLLGGTGATGDPDDLLTRLLGCDSVGRSNHAQWCNDDFEALISEARTTTDPTERSRLYKEAQEIFRDEAPWMILAHSTRFVAMSSKVTGYVMDPRGGHRFDGVDLAE